MGYSLGRELFPNGITGSDEKPRKSSKKNKKKSSSVKGSSERVSPPWSRGGFRE